MASATSEVARDLAAAVRAGCFPSEQEALNEAIRTLFAANPHLKIEVAIQRYLDDEVSLGRAAELAGMTRWTFQELLAQRGHIVEIEVDPTDDLEDAVRGILGPRG